MLCVIYLIPRSDGRFVSGWIDSMAAQFGDGYYLFAVQRVLLVLCCVCVVFAASWFADDVCRCLISRVSNGVSLSTPDLH